MKVIDFETIQKLHISPLDCYHWVSDVIAHKNSMILPAKISMKPGIEGVFYNCMPSIIPEHHWAGVKLVTRYPSRNPSLNSEILLYDLRTGYPTALLNGDYITTMRTGAVAAHSIQLLAVPNFNVLGIIGLGNTARATLLVLISLFPDRKFVIKLMKYKNQHEVFAERFAEYENITFSYQDSYQEVVQNSDVIISAVTVFENDICSDSAFKEGCLVVPIHTRGFTNCDLFFDKIFADDVNHVRGFKYFNRFKCFAEISDVVNGKAPGRVNLKERILAYNIGISVHDIYFAGKIEQMVQDSPEIDLKEPSEKFWL